MLLPPTSYLSVRNDFLDDIDRQRTGNKTVHSSYTIGYIRYFGGGLFTFRPDARYDHAYTAGLLAYDKGTRRDQFTATLNLIMRFK